MYARLSIHDTGLSIDPEILPSLFNKKKSPDGTGFVDLFISNQILNAHGGSISANNNADNKGVTFEVTLPLPDAQFDDDSRAVNSKA